MDEKAFNSPFGTIHYWTNDIVVSRQSLVFLPGLTADHRLFDKQIEQFGSRFNVFVWDAPGHAESRPFRLEFSLKDKAEWLHEILDAEGISKPILVGQSMGGYVSQAFMQHFPGEVAGFVSIDSSTLKKKYYPKWEIKVLYHTEGMYRMYPWKLLVKQGANGTAESEYGRKLMTEIMEVYSDNPRYYSSLVGHGYRMLADAINADLPYNIDCPCLLICGEKDKAGDTKKFNRKWASGENLPIEWIPGAGHNSNTDDPEHVNSLIDDFIRTKGTRPYKGPNYGRNRDFGQLVRKKGVFTDGHNTRMETDRILLRRWQDSDAQALFKYASDPDVGPRAGWPPHQSVEESLEIIRTVFGGETMWAVILKETDEPIGCVGYLTADMSNMPIGDNECEIGYWMARPYWNQGICSEAMSLVIEYCINEKGYSTLWGTHFIDNPASGRVMEKCGFVEAGSLEGLAKLEIGADKPVRVMKRADYIIDVAINKAETEEAI